MSFSSALLERVYSNADVSRARSLPADLLVPHYFTLPPDGDLYAMLDKPYRYFLEACEYPLLDKILDTMLAGRADFTLSLNTLSACRHNVAEAVTMWLNKRIRLESKHLLNIQTCLQEALINAVVHGNLDIEGDYQSLEHFNSHYDLINARLQEDRYRNRRIMVSAWYSEGCLKLAVRDDGRGFSIRDTPKEEGQFCGRGIFLIQSLATRVWTDETQRTLLMTFGDKD